MKQRKEWTAAPLLLCAFFLVFAASASALWVIQPKVSIEKALEQNLLVVRFSDARVALVELRLNGAPFASREAGSTHRAGEVTFSFDPNTLPSGKHKVEVVLRGSDGKVLATTSTEVTIDERPLAPIVIRTPKFGQQVSGEVQVEVQIGPMIKKPYVSLFVDRQFRELRNVPPYRFVWDTNREADGWHSIEAWAYDEQMNTYKSVPVQVYVNNPGGRTERVVETQVPADPLVGGVGRDVEPLEGAKGLKMGTGAATVPFEGSARATQPAEVQRIRSGAVSNPDAFVPVAPGPPAKEIALSDVRLSGQRLVAPPPPERLATSRPKDEQVEQHRGEPAERTVPSEVPRGEAKVSANPETTPLAGSSGKTLLVRAPGATGAARATAPPAPAVLPKAPKPKPSGAFSIFFDGAEIHFDVAPRRVEGVPVAPFRHLFLHGGGDIGWDNLTKTMSAARPGTRIRLRIGDLFANVNESRVKMERPAFLEAGRTIVPLSFVEQALNVEVEYDPSTGHVLITSKE